MPYTAKTKGATAKIVCEFENVGWGGGGGGDDWFSKDDIQKRICIKFNIYINPLMSLAVLRIRIILIRIRIRIQDVKKFVTDPDPGKNDTDPDPAKRTKYQENLQKV